ncbi:hypothetical protein ACN2XU_12965 [Primorskyibacter sp. 2E107]|uniref:hypothetical protein n=1 Tax=Primorskyibacter sp. 2E107 TaxID=3403458 RepID=UPI003AF5907D
MRARLVHSYKKQPVLTLLFAVALLASVFFGGRLIVHSVFWANPAHRDQTIAGWMTPGYVAHSWQVPNEIVGDALGLTKDSFQPGQTLDELAKARGVPFQSLSVDLYNAITAFRTAPHD